MHKFDFTGLAELTASLCESKVPVYLTIDLDCLDPSCFPGTGTPEAGGVSFLQLLDAIRTVLFKNKKAYVQAGAGIVADSIPKKEYEETQKKALAVINAIKDASQI